MKAQSIKNICVGLLISWGSLAHAGPVISAGGVGQMGTYISCAGSESEFSVRATAIPTFKQGWLLRKGKPTTIFSCKKENRNLVVDQPSAGQILWSCREYPFHDGNLLVRIEESGVTGLTSAYVSRMQMHPLQPQALSTLNCQR